MSCSTRLPRVSLKKDYQKRKKGMHGNNPRIKITGHTDRIHCATSKNTSSPEVLQQFPFK
jgi:flagellar motor protein MotB